ncbi:MAG TPA: CoA-binding protein [Bacteroidales bacterium]|jgi:predicted CoA-binding protein|nr:CoA-binding protein [Bacteroidales bacterium]
MTTIKQINEFIESQPIAMVGVSRNPKKFGQAAFRELKEKGLRIIPVNPEADQILGEKSYRSISMLPPEVGGVIIMTKKNSTASVVREAKEKGIKNIWIQQHAETPEALEELKGTGINCITGECILMHFRANGIHKFHGMIMKLFGRFPK